MAKVVPVVAIFQRTTLDVDSTFTAPPDHELSYSLYPATVVGSFKPLQTNTPAADVLW